MNKYDIGISSIGDYGYVWIEVVCKELEKVDERTIIADGVQIKFEDDIETIQLQK